MIPREIVNSSQDGLPERPARQLLCNDDERQTHVNTVYDYKKGLSSMAVVYAIWGFQPLYFSLDSEIDTSFLLAGRIVWAVISCLVILILQKKTEALSAVFRDRKILLREIPAAALLFADWALYIVGVRTGRVLECAMGYYIMPIVMVVFGAVIFREKLSLHHFLALAFICAGILFSARGFGGFPLLTVLLALCFSVYSAIKKKLDVDSVVGTTAESMIMLPFALLYIVCFRSGENGLAGLTLQRQLFIAGSGLITAVPMAFFARGLSCLPLLMTGIMQYVSPTLGILCSLILGETLTKEKLLSFAFIWAGVIIYTVFELKKNVRS